MRSPWLVDFNSLNSNLLNSNLLDFLAVPLGPFFT